MKNLFYTLIMTVLFAASAMAQGTIDEGSFPAEMIKLNLAGVQSAEGTVDQVNNMRVGNTFVLNGGDAELSYHLTMSMDYTAADPDLVSGNQVVSGTWTVTVYKNEVYFGVMYGDISGGAIRWNTNEQSVLVSRQTEAQFTITGGMDGYADQAPMTLERGLSGTTIFSGRGQPATEATVDLPLSSR